MQKGNQTLLPAFYRMLCSGSNVRESFLIDYTNAKAESVAIIAPKTNGVASPTLSTETPRSGWWEGLPVRLPYDRG